MRKDTHLPDRRIAHQVKVSFLAFDDYIRRQHQGNYSWSYCTRAIQVIVRSTQTLTHMDAKFKRAAKREANRTQRSNTNKWAHNERFGHQAVRRSAATRRTANSVRTPPTQRPTQLGQPALHTVLVQRVATSSNITGLSGLSCGRGGGCARKPRLRERTRMHPPTDQTRAPPNTDTAVQHQQAGTKRTFERWSTRQCAAAPPRRPAPPRPTPAPAPPRPTKGTPRPPRAPRTHWPRSANPSRARTARRNAKPNEHTELAVPRGTRERREPNARDRTK